MNQAPRLAHQQTVRVDWLKPSKQKRNINGVSFKVIISCVYGETSVEPLISRIIRASKVQHWQKICMNFCSDEQYIPRTIQCKPHKGLPYLQLFKGCISDITDC